MRVSVPENFQNSAVGRFLFLEKFFQPWIFHGRCPCQPLNGRTVHGARGCAPEGQRNGHYRHGARTKTSAWGNIAAKITDQSAHPATSRVLDPLQCPVLGLGEGDATALQSKRQTG